MSPNVLGVAGSLRHDSWNRRLLGALAELAADDLRLTVYDGLEQIPLFNEDAEEPTPPGVRQLREAVRGARSEEHTSELQSPMYLVCRLLLEKKNRDNDLHNTP